MSAIEPSVRLLSAESEEPIRPALRHDRPIGAILLDAGLIQLQDVDRIVQHAEAKGLRFGDAAVALRLVKQSDLDEALAYQFDYQVVADGASLISREVIAAYQSHHPVLEDLRALRNQLQLRWLHAAEGRLHRAVAVVSAERDEGRTFVAANLAVTFSQLGQRTLLVDANLRQPRVHSLFGLPSDAGLSALLADRAVDRPIHRTPDLRDLSVVPAGAIPPNPGDLIARQAFQVLLHRYEQTYDVVIIDTPAAAAGPDAITIAARARGCVVVAKEGRTSFDALADLAGELRAAGSTIIGSVMSGA